MHFCEIFGFSKLLTGQENGSQKGIAGCEFGSQISLAGRNLALKYHYWTIIWLSTIITEQKFGFQTSLPDDFRPVMIFESNFCPVMIFENQISVR